MKYQHYPPPCPKCESPNVREYLYGLLIEPPDEAKYIPAGCVVETHVNDRGQEIYPPRFVCLACQHEWGRGGM